MSHRLQQLWFNSIAHLGYRRLAIREFLLSGCEPPASAGILVSMEVLEESELGEYNEFRKPRDEGSAARRVAAGDMCFVARHDGRIVGACWTATGRAWSEYLSRWITLAPDEAYAYDAYTAPDFRGMGVLPAVTRGMHAFHGKAGKRRMIGFTVPENTASMVSAIGYRTVGVTGTVRIGPLRWDFTRMDRKSPPRWDTSFELMDTRGHYLDEFLADLKRRAYLELIDRWGGVPANGRVLKTDLFEEAMGPDAFLLDLAGSRLLLGMDVSESAAVRARKRDDEPRARYLRADARRLPFASGCIDLIVSPSTLDHFHEPGDLGASLLELRRVLAPGGRLIITLDNRQNVFDPLLRLVSRLGLVPFYMGRSYSARELRRELDSAGFDVLATSAIVHNPRLTATGAVAAARRLRWRPFTRFVQSVIRAMQRLEGTRLEYYSGCFVAALAVPRGARS